MRNLAAKREHVNSSDCFHQAIGIIPYHSSNFLGNFLRMQLRQSGVVVVANLLQA